MEIFLDRSIDASGRRSSWENLPLYCVKQTTLVLVSFLFVRPVFLVVLRSGLLTPFLVLSVVVLKEVGVDGGADGGEVP